MQAHTRLPQPIKPDAGNNVGSSIQHLDGVAKVEAGLAYGADKVPQMHYHCVLFAVRTIMLILKLAINRRF